MRLVRCFFGDGDIRGGESSQVGLSITRQVRLLQQMLMHGITRRAGADEETWPTTTRGERRDFLGSTSVRANLNLSLSSIRQAYPSPFQPFRVVLSIF